MEYKVKFFLPGTEYEDSAQAEYVGHAHVEHPVPIDILATRLLMTERTS